MLLLSACGVKKAPLPPASITPSIFDAYEFNQEENIEKNKENDKKQ